MSGILGAGAMPAGSRRYSVALLACLALIALWRLLAAWHGNIELYADEAQYWTWALQPDWGYFSKPPMVAWAIGLGQALFGDSEIGVRAISLLIEHCANKQGRVLQSGSYDNSAVSIYLASFSNGMPIAIDVARAGPMKESFERGRKLFHLKAGAFNFACSSCHSHNIGRRLRGNVITTPYGDAAHYPVYKTQYMLQSLHLRFVECNLDTRTQPLLPGSRPYTDLEVFLTALSNGYPVTVPAERDW